MYQMAVLSSDETLNDRIRKICTKLRNYFEPTFFDNKTDSLEFLKYNMPEVNLINFSDKNFNYNDVFELIRNDQWLHYGGIIVVHRTSESKKVLDAIESLNVIATISRKDFVRDFFRLQKILIQNRQILFQRDLQKHLLKFITGSFVMDNDPFNVRTYSNLIPNYLYNIGYINFDIKENLHIVLFEILMNAIEHGNCNISYEEKTTWLEEHGDILDLVRQKNLDEEIRERKVYFSYTITPEQSRYVIRDDGNGFDWKSRMETKTDYLEQHGRGIKMAEYYTKNFRYNDSGNEASFEVVHKEDSTSIIPAIFRDQEITTFKNNEIIFTEGDESNYMYYIVSGKFNIYRNNMHVANLTKDDLFLGEMSFLLSNNRSATVRSNGESQMIMISKKDIMSSFQTHPHYGILISRLLARRLQRINEHTSKLKNAIIQQHPEMKEFIENLESEI